MLLTAAELDLFTALSRASRSAEQLAAELGANVRALTILLDALAALGLLSKSEGTYRSVPSAACYLSSDSPQTVLPMVLHSVNLWDRWGKLTSIVAGPAATRKATENSLEAFIGAMHVVASPITPRIVALVDPGPARRLIDVGGASGTYAVAFMRASPGLHATIFDRPAVLSMARALLTTEGMTDRVTLAAGDFYVDPLPTGHDLAFVSAIIHQNSPAQNVELFRKVYAALDAGGRIVVRDHVLSEDRTQPRRGAMFAVNMLVGTGGGNSYTYAEIADGLTQAGFERVKLIHADSHMDGLVEAFKPT